MAKQERERNVQSLAQMFRILGDQTRLNILMSLQEGELNVTELCKKLKAPQPTVSHHLGILRMAGMVNNRRGGKEIYYSNSVDAERYQKALKTFVDEGDSLRIGPVLVGWIS